ncbi:MAG: T9SS type A sorting domain-containing protein [Chitinophagales bacterium]|nr:T9SS type A sorting domain-containing protein [Chitinophagales bacterium]MDW8419382.1 PHB depolymerase family esterase [Chitinophagales bacterium]
MRIYSKLFTGLLCWMASLSDLKAQLGPWITKSIQHNGITRSALLHVPNNYQPGDTLPLLLCFHGLNQTPKRIAEVTGFDTIADRENFIVAYPLGKDTVWNTFSNPYFSGTDDVGFVSHLIDSIHADYPINFRRVYATGMSNGGFMCYKLACHLSHRIAAIAPLAGALTDSMRYYCAPLRPVPILHIHGTSDFLVGYNSGVLNISVPATLQYWVQHNQCPTPETTTSLPNINTQDNSTVTLLEWKPCLDATEVVHYKINSGGHTWPGSAVTFSGLGGNVNRDIIASEVIWEFLSRFSLSDIKLGETKYVKHIPEIYPLPASRTLYINGKDIVYNKFAILDIRGRELLSGISSQGAHQFTIDISDIPSGMYLLLLTDIHNRVHTALLPVTNNP